MHIGIADIWMQGHKLLRMHFVYLVVRMGCRDYFAHSNMVKRKLEESSIISYHFTLNFKH